MPAEAVVVVAVVIGMFAIFMLALGAVWVWTNLPDDKAIPAPAAGATPATAKH